MWTCNIIKSPSSYKIAFVWRTCWILRYLSSKWEFEIRICLICELDSLKRSHSKEQLVLESEITTLLFLLFFFGLFVTQSYCMTLNIVHESKGMVFFFFFGLFGAWKPLIQFHYTDLCPGCSSKMAWEWVNNERIYIFRWTIALHKTRNRHKVVVNSAQRKSFTEGIPSWRKLLSDSCTFQWSEKVLTVLFTPTHFSPLPLSSMYTLLIPLPFCLTSPQFLPTPAHPHSHSPCRIPLCLCPSQVLTFPPTVIFVPPTLSLSAPLFFPSFHLSPMFKLTI